MKRKKFETVVDRLVLKRMAAASANAQISGDEAAFPTR
jgi:hypothetical protein